MTGKSFGRFWWGGSLLWKERLQDRDWWGKCVRWGRTEAHLVASTLCSWTACSSYLIWEVIVQSGPYVVWFPTHEPAVALVPGLSLCYLSQAPSLQGHRLQLCLSNLWSRLKLPGSFFCLLFRRHVFSVFFIPLPFISSSSLQRTLDEWGHEKRHGPHFAWWEESKEVSSDDSRSGKHCPHLSHLWQGCEAVRRVLS